MSKATLPQGQQLLNLVAQSDIQRDEFQEFLGSGEFTKLLWKFIKPRITWIRVPVNYTRTLGEMRDAAHLDRYCLHFDDKNFPVEVGESGDRAFAIICFRRELHDDEDPAKSELLLELDKLGLQPEGPPELCAVGEHRPDLECIARRQTWRNYDGELVFPMLYTVGGKRQIELGRCNMGRSSMWHSSAHFLASRKPVRKQFSLL